MERPVPRRAALRLAALASLLGIAAVPGRSGATAPCPEPCTDGKTCVAGVCRFVSPRQRAWEQRQPAPTSVPQGWQLTVPTRLPATAAASEAGCGRHGTAPAPGQETQRVAGSAREATS